MPFPLRLGALILLAASAFTAAPAFSAALAAADQNGGYSGKVLDKVIAVWAPPPALKGDFEIRVRVSLDGQGKVLECKPTKPRVWRRWTAPPAARCVRSPLSARRPYGMPPGSASGFLDRHAQGQGQSPGAFQRGGHAGRSDGPSQGRGRHGRAASRFRGGTGPGARRGHRQSFRAISA